MEEEWRRKWDIAVLALAFLVDYQEFAPLPGGNLGTSAQSQVLHMKSRGKGPGLFMKLFAHFMNFGGVLPRSVTFEWDEQDVCWECSSRDREECFERSLWIACQ